MKVSLSYRFYQKMPSHLFSRPFSQESYQSSNLILQQFCSHSNGYAIVVVTINDSIKHLVFVSIYIRIWTEGVISQVNLVWPSLSLNDAPKRCHYNLIGALLRLMQESH